MVVLALANAKGGVGKSTVAVHLATGLAREGKRALLVDLDPQGNASSWLLGKLPVGSKGAAEALLKDGALGEELHPVTTCKGLTVLPSTPALAGADLALAQEIGGELALKRALAKVSDQFDIAILDCPPSLGLTVLNALCAADAVLTPVLAAYMSLSGLRRLEDTVTRICERLNVRTRVLGYVLFASDSRESITAETRELLRKEAGDKFFKAEVRTSTAAKSLPAHHKTAWDAGSDPRGAEDYKALLKEVKTKLGGFEKPTQKAAKGAQA